MASRSKAPRRSSRTTVVPLTSAASGARIIDLIPLPVPLFVAFRVLYLLAKHWVLTGITIIAMYVYLRDVAECVNNQEREAAISRNGSLDSCLTADFPLYFGYGIAVALLLPLGAFLYVWLTNRHVPITRPLTVARAALRMWSLKRHWPSVRHAAHLTDGPHPPRLPWFRRPLRIADQFGNAVAVRLDTSGVNGTADTIERQRIEMADNLRCRRVRVRKIRPGLAEVTFEWGLPARKSIEQTGLPVFDLDIEEPGRVQIELDKSLLVVGESGSGKSTLGWHFLNELNRQEVPYNVTAVDPKQIELPELQDSPKTVKYANDSESIKAALRDFREQMEYTLAEMKSQGRRKVRISQETPLNILLIDELLLIGDEFKNDPSQTDLGKVLILGRAAGFIVIGESQLSQGDALGRIRDLFPQRICMATKSGHITNAVLGPKAEENGALCSEITEPGVGYIFTDSLGRFERFRAPDIPDTGVQTIAQGNVWDAPRSQVRPGLSGQVKQGGYVYTLWPAATVDSSMDADSRPLYVGQAKNPNSRFRRHAAEKPWWHQVDHSRTQISAHYRTKTELDEAEQDRIREMQPIFNLVHKDWDDHEE